ncbi:MAG: thioredoxin family protein, partial [Bacteroidota bacterium]
VKMALVYGLSIVATFTGLGLLMALLVGASGAQTIAANPWVNLFIGLVFVVFALSLIGAFELRVPNRLLNYVNQQGNERSGWIGVVFMGLTLTLVSFSCTVPFVGALLAATAGGEWSWPILGMVAFSTVFALPFVVFAAFPSGLKKLPKSGSWMGALTVTLGFIEMAAAFKFLSNADLVWGWGLISRPLVIAVWSVLFFVAGLYLIGKVRLSHEPPIESVGAGRLLSGIAAMALAIYLLPGLLGAPLGTLDAWLPPRQASDVSLLAGLSTEPGERPDGLAWHGNDEGPADAAIEAAFAESAQTGRPVFVDFTGYTCTNCRQMEATVFPKPAIAGRLSQDFVLLQLYTDAPEEGRALQRYQLELTGTVALPTYAIVSADRQLVAKWEGMASVEDFATFLEAGAARYAQATARAGG